MVDVHESSISHPTFQQRTGAENAPDLLQRDMQKLEHFRDFITWFEGAIFGT